MQIARLQTLSLLGFAALALSACSNANSSDDDVGDEGTTAETSADTSAAETSADATADTSDTGEALRPNWHEDIAPLVYGSCVGCHFDGGIAPFGLETYEQAAPWGSLIDEVVSSGVMPPWGALETDECQPAHGWRDDARLSDAEIQLLADWVDLGTPEGDPANAAALPEPPSLELANPSMVLQNPAPFTVTGPGDSFVCVAIDPQIDQDVWITGVQMVPDNAQVVHHVLMYVDTLAASDAMIDANGTFPCSGFVSFDGSMQIGTWVPGAVPTQTPPDVGFPMPAGSRIVLAYHYHPTGAGDEIDQSSVALRFTEQAPGLNAVMGLFGNGQGLEPGPNDPGGVPTFMIPPNVADHTETMSFEIPALVPPIPIFTLGTHMHYVGVDMKIWVERAGQDICLLQTPRWDFNWQRNYDIDAPIDELPYVQGGDVVKIRCTFDNTLDNPHLVGALAQQGLTEPQTVFLGEESLDEMCLMLFGAATNLPIDQF